MLGSVQRDQAVPTPSENATLCLAASNSALQLAEDIQVVQPRAGTQWRPAWPFLLGILQQETAGSQESLGLITGWQETDGRDVTCQTINWTNATTVCFVLLRRLILD
jgi:hypothetical protein